MPKAPPKQSTVAGAPAKQFTMRGAPILLPDISFLQPSPPAGITLPPGVPRSEDFLDHNLDLDLTIDLEHYPLPAIRRLSWFRSHSLNNPQSLIHKPQLWQRLVCSFYIQDVSHNHFIPTASRQPKPQPYISMADGFTCYSSSKIADLPVFSLGILRVLFEHSLISTNVRSRGTIQVPALLLKGFASDCHPILLNWCRRRLCSCGCLCWCWAHDHAAHGQYCALWPTLRHL